MHFSGYSHCSRCRLYGTRRLCYCTSPGFKGDQNKRVRRQQQQGDFLTHACSHLDAKWSTVHIPSLTSTLPITSAGAAHCCHCCVIISASRPGGVAAWAENAWSTVLCWHLRHKIAAACRAANLSAAFLQDLHERMHRRFGTYVAIVSFDWCFNRFDTPFIVDSVVLLTSVHGLSPVQSNTPQVRHVGYKLPKVLRPQRNESLGTRRVVVSVGTMVQPPQSLLLCIADTIASIPDDVAVLWSVRGLENSTVNAIKLRLGKRKMKLLSWIQQAEELCDKSTRAFISHAGFNSVAE